MSGVPWHRQPFGTPLLWSWFLTVVYAASDAPDQQLEGLAVVRNLQPPADASFRERSHALVLQLVDRGNASDVVQAALAALKEWGHQTPRTFVT